MRLDNLGIRNAWNHIGKIRLGAWTVACGAKRKGDEGSPAEIWRIHSVMRDSLPRMTFFIFPCALTLEVVLVWQSVGGNLNGLELIRPSSGLNSAPAQSLSVRASLFRQRLHIQLQRHCADPYLNHQLCLVLLHQYELSDWPRTSGFYSRNEWSVACETQQHVFNEYWFVRIALFG